jgi:hypothetical protein
MFTKDKVVLHAEDERFLKNLARRAMGKTVYLSYFQRQEAYSLGLHKAIDAGGNLDLNEAANIMTQTPGRRVSPNVQASQAGRFFGDSVVPVPNKADTVKKSQSDLMIERANCARHCQKNNKDIQGRTSCPRCHGAGFNAVELTKSNQARHNL